MEGEFRKKKNSVFSLNSEPELVELKVKLTETCLLSFVSIFLLPPLTQPFFTTVPWIQPTIALLHLWPEDPSHPHDKCCFKHADTHNLWVSTWLNRARPVWHKVGPERSSQYSGDSGCFLEVKSCRSATQDFCPAGHSRRIEAKAQEEMQEYS